MELKERIKQALKEAELSQSELARRCGVDPSAINHLVNGRTKTLSGELLISLAWELDVRPDWLAIGEEPMRFDQSKMDPEHRAKNRMALVNVAPAPDLRGTVPIISFVQAGDFCEAIDNLQPGEGERIPVSVPVHPHTFALRVVGDSMEPDFPAGIIIVVEPGMDALPGDFVVAKNGDDATFKQFVKDGPDYYLKPLNPRYPIKPLGDSHIIGVVREAIRKLR